MDLYHQIILIRDIFILYVLSAIFIYDFRWYIIPNKLVYPGIVIIFITNLYLGEQMVNLFLGIIIVSGFFYIQYIFSRGRWIGLGDVKLGILMGVILGFPDVLIALFLSYILGSIVAIFLLITGRVGVGDKLPFGTFLTISTIITMFFGELLLNWYLNLYIL